MGELCAFPPGQARLPGLAGAARSGGCGTEPVPPLCQNAPNE